MSYVHSGSWLTTFPLGMRSWPSEMHCPRTSRSLRVYDSAIDCAECTSTHAAAGMRSKRARHAAMRSLLVAYAGSARAAIIIAVAS